MARTRIDVRELQAPIRERYNRDPRTAQIRLSVRSGQSDLSDPLHCAVVPESVPEVSWRSGAHPAVGGSGDVPCSGDVLLGDVGVGADVDDVDSLDPVVVLLALDDAGDDTKGSCQAVELI